VADDSKPIDARGSTALVIGSHNTQINYYYGRTATDGVAPPPLITFSGEIESPYRGLAAFEERDAAFFHGRETSVALVLERMSRLLGQSGLLVVSGVSGAGKSSLLRAGVLPRIRGEGLADAPEARDWPCLVFTPGPAPLDELAVRTAALAGIDSASVRASLTYGPAAFALTARQAALKQSASRLLLIVDQFEQVFRNPDQEQQNAFITALHAAATLGHDERQLPAAMVVLVVRADFEAHCADHPLLTAAIQDRYLVTAMTRRQLRLAITEPAAKAGGAVDDALVEILLREVGGAGALPLLSHALDQAWRRRLGQTLTVADYERTGGIEGAVATSAQGAYDRLSPAQQTVARAVFTRLSATSADGTDIARRATRDELFEGKDDARTHDVNAVLESFAAERLVTLAADTVEISHEVLLRSWPLLRDEWLAETHADRLTRTRLNTRTAEWVDADRDASYLYRGNPLDEATKAAERAAADPGRHPSLSRDEQDFLLASRRAQRRGARRRQAFTALLMVLVLGLATIAVVAYRAGNEAVHQRDVAASNQVAVQSTRVTDPVLSRLQSLAAWRINPSPDSRYAMKVAAARADIAVLTGHSGWVLNVAFTPDGRTLVSTGDDDTIRLWDVTTHRQVGDAFTAGVGPVLTLAVSPDGRTIATGGTHSDVRLWDVASHRQIAALPADAQYIGSVAFSPDGRMLANSNGDGSALLWDLATRRQVARLVGHPGHSGSVELAFSPDSRTLASVADTVRLWDTATHSPLGDPLTGHTKQVSSLQFSPDGKTLATSAETVRLWNVAARSQIGTLPTGEDAYVNSIDFTSDGRLLATGDSDGEVRLWDTATRRQIGAALSPSGNGPLAFSPDGTTVATAGFNGMIRLWNTARVVGTPIQGHSGSVNAVAYSPDGGTIATAGDDGTLRFWSAATHEQIGVPLTGHTGPIIGAAYSPDGSLVATTSGDGSLRLWDTRGRSLKRTVATEPGVYVSAAFSPDGTTLAIAGEDGPIRLVRIGDGASTPIAGADNPHVLVPPGGQVSGAADMWVAFSPDGRTVAAAHGDEVRLWDTSTHQQIGKPFTGHAGLLTALAFSPDGTKLATGSKDQTVRLWDVASHRLIGTPLTDYSDTVTAVAFSRDGASLATVAGAGVRLWDVATGQQIGALIADDDESVTAMAFSADGATLATASRHGHARLWNVSYLVDDLPHRLCTEAGRSLTREEWAQYVPSGPEYRQIC
jgi:WD40 repeat protein